MKNKVPFICGLFVILYYEGARGLIEVVEKFNQQIELLASNDNYCVKQFFINAAHFN